MDKAVVVLCNGRRIYTLSLVLARINESIKKHSLNVIKLCVGRLNKPQRRLCIKYGYRLIDTTDIENTFNENVRGKDERIRISLSEAVNYLKLRKVKYAAFLGDDELLHTDALKLAFDLIPYVKCIRFIPSDYDLNLFWIMNTRPSLGLSIVVNLNKLEFPFRYGCPHHGSHNGNLCFLVPLPVIHIAWFEDIISEVKE